MKSILVTFFVVLFLQVVTNAQSNSVKEKLENLKGDLKKITITTDEDEIEFTGKDTEELYSKIKKDKDIFRVFLSGDSSNFDNRFFTWKDKNDPKLNRIKLFKKEKGNFEFFDEEDNRKEIEVEIKNGKKKVTVTTYKNGEEKVETFTGDEAEKFILEHEDTDDQIDVKVEKLNDDSETIIIKKKKIKKETGED